MQAFKKKVNEQPRCSIAKLGEYVAKQSSPARRREIVRSQKFPPAFQTVTYSGVNRIIVEHIVSGFDDDILSTAIEDLVNQYDYAEKDFEKKRASCSIDAIHAFQLLSKELDLDKCAISPGPRSWSLELGGVQVSVRPEVLVEVKGRNDAIRKGYIKLYFSKSFALDDKAAGVITAVTMAKASESTATAISREHVMVVDVFGQRIFTAPKSTKRFLNEAEAACEEIAFHWQRFEAS